MRSDDIDPVASDAAQNDVALIPHDTAEPAQTWQWQIPKASVLAVVRNSELWRHADDETNRERAGLPSFLSDSLITSTQVRFSVHTRIGFTVGTAWKS